MAKKNVYFFKVVITDKSTNRSINPNEIKNVLKTIFRENGKNNSLRLCNDDIDKVVLDIIEDTSEYLFAKLSKKKPNFSIQKRNYETLETTDVLLKDEVGNNGVESFTFFILGYKHGILSIINVKGAPNDNTLKGIFELYNDNFSMENEAIPNKEMINQLKDGSNPKINRLKIGIAQPNAKFLQDILKWSDTKICDEMSLNSSSVVFEIRPHFRKSLLDNISDVKNLIFDLVKHRDEFESLVITGKPNDNENQREYDLFEEYFKYQIDVKEYSIIDGRKREKDKKDILEDYKKSMQKIYDDNKLLLLTMANRM